MDCLTFGRRHQGGGGGKRVRRRAQGRTGGRRAANQINEHHDDERREHAKDDGGGAIPHLMADALVVVLAGEIDSTRPLHLNRLTSTTLMFRSTG